MASTFSSDREHPHGGPVSTDDLPGSRQRHAKSGRLGPTVRGLAHGWVIVLWSIVIAFAVVTFVRSRHIGIPVRDPGGTIFALRLAGSLGLFGLLTVLDASIRAGRRGWTPRKVATVWRVRWTKDRLALAVSGLLAYYVVYACYRNLKSWVAFNHQHDNDLLRLDKWLFLGHSPAVLLHDLFGQHLAAHVFQAIYGSFTYVVPVSFVAAMVFAERIRDGYVFLSSAMWVWILGVGSYYLIPALGPFASAPREFAGLDHTKVTATQIEYMTERAQLLHHPAVGDSFSSVAAFASLHTGFTFLVLLMLRYYGFRRAAKGMAVYLVAVMVSTIYLGWHYVVDDAAGLVLALIAVRLGRFTTYPRGRLSP